MENEVNNKDLRERYERDELQGDELVNALMVLFGYDKARAELIASGDFEQRTEGDTIITT